MHVYRKSFTCCDLCYSAASLGAADAALAHAFTGVSRAEGVLEFGRAAQFEDICSYLQNPAPKALVLLQLDLVPD